MSYQFKSEDPVSICQEIVRICNSYKIDGHHQIKNSCLLIATSMAALLEDNLILIESDTERKNVLNFVRDLTLDKLACVERRIFGEK